MWQKIKNFFKEKWRWILGLFFGTALAVTVPQVIDTPEVVEDPPRTSGIEYVTAPENNTFKIGAENYQDEFKPNITDDKALQYKLDDKYIAFRPTELKWDNEELRGAKAASKLEDSNEYKGVFGKGIDLAVNTGGRIWSKVIRIDALKDLGPIPKDAEYLEIEFEMDTNFIVDGWDGESEMEITDKVRLGDFSYIEPAMAWDSYEEEVCETIEDDEVCETLTNRVPIRSFFKKGKLVKRVPVEWLRDAQFPIWTDTDVTYGSALEFTVYDAQGISAVGISDNKFVVCYIGTSGSYGYGYCRVGSVAGTTITYGANNRYEFDNYKTTDVAVCKNGTNDDEFIVAYGDDGDDDGDARVGVVSGETIVYDSVAEYSLDPEWVSCASLSADKALFFFNDEAAGDDPTGLIATVAGDDTLSYGPDANPDTTNTAFTPTGATKIGTDKFVVAWSDISTRDGRIVVGTATDTTVISWGTEVEFADGETTYSNQLDSIEDDKFIHVHYNHEFGDYAQRLNAVTVSGTTMTRGATFEVGNFASAYDVSVALVDSTHFVVTYTDGSPNYYGTSRYCTVNWSTRVITCGSGETYASADTQGQYSWRNDVAKIATEKVVICYPDGSDGNDGYCIIGTTPSAAPPTRRIMDIE